jgi:hypothetical protein|tara:strand:+ start:2725 stop:3108 length:384 start_codon:yes stop_codon:yes gene_type:complete
MIKFNKLLKVIFHFTNITLILFYLYPGSIIGYILYNNFTKQPQISRDFLSISSNHFYTFLFFSIIGILAYINDKKIDFLIKYLFLISIILELFHLIIPTRAFQLSDIFGNILGVLVAFIIYKVFKYN